MNHARSNKEARTHPTLEPAPPEDSLGRAGISGLVSLRPCTQFRHPQHPTGLGNQPKPGRLWLAGKQLHSSSYFEANCARQQPCAAAVRTPSRARLEPAHAMPEQGRQAAGACNTPLRHTQTQAQVELVAPANTSIANAERAIHVRWLHAPTLVHLRARPGVRACSAWSAWAASRRRKAMAMESWQMGPIVVDGHVFCIRNGERHDEQQCEPRLTAST